MFDPRFANKFTLVDKQKRSNHTEFTYSFKCARTRQMYIVIVLHFELDIYIIKFYLKAHRLSPNKFKLLTKLNNVTRILVTCIEILVSIYQKHPNASFGFIGERGEYETDEITKRFSLYRRLVINTFSEKLFLHRQYEEENAYIMFSKNNTTPNLIYKVEKLFTTNYHLVTNS